VEWGAAGSQVEGEEADRKFFTLHVIKVKPRLHLRFPSGMNITSTHGDISTFSFLLGLCRGQKRETELEKEG
jgi:hypothetical protein